MKLLHCIHSIDPSTGGPVEYIRHLGHGLAKLGHSQEILCLDDPGKPFLNSFEEGTVHALGPGFTSWGYSPALKPWLRQNASRFDMVIVNGLWKHVGLAVNQVLKEQKRPYVLFPHGMLDPWFKQALPLKHLKKMLYWRLVEHRVLSQAYAVCFTAQEEAVLARSTFSPYKVNEIIVGHGLGKPEGDARAQMAEAVSTFPQLNGKKVFLFLGRIHEKKGVDLLVESFSEICRKGYPGTEDFILVIAGPQDGAYARSLVERSCKLPDAVAERIVWTGMVQGDIKWGLLRLADALILPSHQENFGVVVAEALACGTPVLISNKVNIWREIKTNRAGLVAPDTLKGTKELLLGWLAEPEWAKQQFRDNAKHAFESGFVIEAVANKLVDIVEQAHSMS
jgi:glycosyltransferase involved in cell wall biosynthesis